ncbi:unnamed protein product [Symbiodinium necroappetens]|uniref:Uncharacterized protein n=1 Tax=Symbiodinium necroappetens TaxID=1628268 RepID=A0A813B6G6_9DINO|nr:unnamed protein product [Symbiodinium necroappetens]
MPSRAWSLDTLRLGLDAVELQQVKEEVLDRDIKEVERLLQAEMNQDVQKRPLKNTPSKQPEPSPNVAPLKKSKTALDSPLKPMHLSFSPDSGKAGADRKAATATASAACAENDLPETYIEGSDVYTIVEVPEFGPDRTGDSHPYVMPWHSEADLPEGEMRERLKEALGGAAVLNPYSEEYMYRTKSKAASTDALSDAVSTATASSEYEARYKALQDICRAKDAQIETLLKELEDAKETIRKGSVSNTGGEVTEEPVDAEVASVAPAVAVTGAAAKQRLRRLCERRADGRLQVPEEIHDQWKAGGASRERLLKIWVGSGMDKDSFVREVTHETKKSKELKISVTGDFFTEEEMKEELGLPKCPVLHESGLFFDVDAQQDTYNAGKTRFWCERKTTASMEQAHRTEITDRMTMEAEPDMDEKGENVLIRDDCHGFNLSDFDIGAGASASGAGSSSDNPGMLAGSGKDPVAQLGLPKLMGGVKPEVHLMTYQSCLMNRMAKLTDSRSKPDSIPVKDQTDAVKKLLEKIDANLSVMDALHDQMSEIYAEASVQGHGPGQSAALVDLYQKATRAAKAEPSVPRAKPKAGAKVAPAKKAEEAEDHERLLSEIGAQCTFELEDPAKRVVSLARSIEQEAPGCLRGIKLMSNVDLSHAEIRLHKLVREWGLTLDIPMSFMRQGLFWVPILHVPDWMTYMLHKEPRVLVGGYTVRDPEVHWHLRAFWHAYRHEDTSHEVYMYHSDRLHVCIPYFLYLDEGRGYRKSPVMIVAFESVLGVATKRNFDLKNAGRSSYTDDDEHFRACLDAQLHTSKGSSLMSRFAVTAIPHQWYRTTKEIDRSQVFHNTITKISEKCRDLFYNGCEDKHGQKWYGVLIGLKGDSPALAKAGKLTANFMRLGKDKRICHMCMAGLDDLPWEDVSNRASWQSTLYEERPWDAENVSALLSIPYDASKPEALFKNDPFHVVKYGIARHFTASCLVTLIFLDIFPGELNNVEVRLERAYSDFRSACRQLKSSPNLKGFTREIIHLKHNDSWPWGGYKGSDCTLMLRWLVRLLRYGPCDNQGARTKGPLTALFARDAATQGILEAMLDGACSCLLFFEIINKSGLWLNRQQATKAKPL